jgi:hypothetical protein
MNYIGSTRSNYFAVKDLDAFKEFLKQAGGDVELIEGEGAQKGLVGFIVGRGSDSGCLPSQKEVFDPGDAGGMTGYEDFDFIGELAPHLADGYVGVVIEIGSEGLRALNGNATAFNNEGEVKQVGLSDIYDLAKGMGATVTRAEY